jgi:hypothetical protein
MWVYDPSALSFLSYDRVPPRSHRVAPGRETSLDYQPRTSPNEDAGKHQLVQSYLSAAPRAELLNHLANQPGTGEPPRLLCPFPD